jgi:hypothetical protein
MGLSGRLVVVEVPKTFACVYRLLHMV